MATRKVVKKQEPKNFSNEPEFTADNILTIDDGIWASKIANGEVNWDTFVKVCYERAETLNDPAYREKVLRIKTILDNAGIVV